MLYLSGGLVIKVAARGKHKKNKDEGKKESAREITAKSCNEEEKEIEGDKKKRGQKSKRFNLKLHFFV